MAGFNMMDLMNGASKSETKKPSYELQEIPIVKLIPNPANTYSLDGIDELADSILLAGRVLQNLVVKPADENGNYMIISGHRRHLASKMLVEQGHNEFATVSALIENERNEALQELMLIYTNSTARVLTDAEKMRQATRATELLKDLKDKGQFNEKIRDAVAKMLNTTTGQIGRYLAIANNLKNEDLKEKFESGEMGVSAAYEASRLSVEGQNKIAEQTKEGKNVSVYDIKQEKKQEDEAAERRKVKLFTNIEGLPVKDIKLNIPAKFKVEITIHIIEKDGKYYSNSDGFYSGGGHGSLPNTQHDEPYDTEQAAVEAAIKKVATMNKTYHKALWASGYRIVGEPVEEETANKPAHTDSTANVAQTSAQDTTGALPETEDEPEEETPEASTADNEELRSMWIRKKAIMGVIKDLESKINLKAKEAVVWAEENNHLKEKIANEAANFLAELQEAAKESVEELNQILDGADAEFEQEIEA